MSRSESSASRSSRLRADQIRDVLRPGSPGDDEPLSSAGNAAERSSVPSSAVAMQSRVAGQPASGLGRRRPPAEARALGVRKWGSNHFVGTNCLHPRTHGGARWMAVALDDFFVELPIGRRAREDVAGDTPVLGEDAAKLCGLRTPSAPRLRMTVAARGTRQQSHLTEAIPHQRARSSFPSRLGPPG